MIVKLCYHVPIQPAFGCAPEFRRGIDDRVHHRVREVQHKRPARITLILQIVNGPVRVQANQPAHVTRAAGRCIVLMERDTPPVVGTERSEVRVKALGQGHALDNGLAIGHIPLSNAGRLVAHPGHQLGKCDLVSRHAPPPAAYGITAGQQCRTRRAAHMLGIEVGKARALLRQPIHSRRLVRLRAVASQVAIPLIVGKDDQDVGSLSTALRPHHGVE